MAWDRPPDEQGGHAAPLLTLAQLLAAGGPIYGHALDADDQTAAAHMAGLLEG